MWTPPTAYTAKQHWLEHEDKTLASVFGLTSIEEICEAFMCYPSCILQRARQLGLMGEEHSYLTAQHIEGMVRLYSLGLSYEDISDVYGLPDVFIKYYKPPTGASEAAARQYQDAHARQDPNQGDMFNHTEDNESKDTTE